MGEKPLTICRYPYFSFNHIEKNRKITNKPSLFLFRSGICLSHVPQDRGRPEANVGLQASVAQYSLKCPPVPSKQEGANDPSVAASVIDGWNYLPSDDQLTYVHCTTKAIIAVIIIWTDISLCFAFPHVSATRQRMYKPDKRHCVWKLISAFSHARTAGYPTAVLPAVVWSA